MKLRILHIAPNIIRGGIARVSLELTKSLSLLGSEVMLYSPEYINGLNNYIAKYYRARAITNRLRTLSKLFEFSQPLYFSISNRNELMKIINEEKPDIVITHGPYATLRLLLPYNDVPWLIIVHGTYINELRYMRYHPMKYYDKLRYMTSTYTSIIYEKTVYQSLQRKFKNTYWIAVSEQTRKELVNFMKISIGNIFKVLNGVNKDIFKPMNKYKAREILKSKFKINIDDADIILLHVNPGPRKGTHILIKSLQYIKGKIKLLIVGKISRGSYWDYLIGLINDIGKDRVILLGWVDDNDLPILYNSANITVVSSYSEGGPLITPESLACGTPVIATNVGGNAEYLSVADLNDYLINISQYDFSRELAEKIQAMIYDLNSIKINADLIPSWLDIAREYLKIMNDLI